MPKEAVKKANLIVPRPVAYAVWTPHRALKAGDKWPAVLARASPTTPARGANEGGTRAPPAQREPPPFRARRRSVHVWLIYRGHLLGEPSEELLRLGDCGVADPRLLRQPPVANYDDKHPLHVAPYVCHMVHAGSPRERSYREAPHDEILEVGRGAVPEDEDHGRRQRTQNLLSFKYRCYVERHFRYLLLEARLRRRAEEPPHLLATEGLV